MRSVSVSDGHLPRLAVAAVQGNAQRQGRQGGAIMQRRILERNMKCNNHSFCSHAYEVCELDSLPRVGLMAHHQHHASALPQSSLDQHTLEHQQHSTHKLHHEEGPASQASLLPEANAYSHDSLQQIASQITPRNSKISLQQITEEALDDWIAQSANRPLISFLDPYKKFNAPKNLIDQIKRRWGRYCQQGDVDQEFKKMLLFDMENEDPAAFLSAHDTLAPGGVRTRRRYPGYMRPTRQPRERQKDLAFHYTKLEPHVKPGQPITLREEEKYEHIRENHQNHQTMNHTKKSHFIGDALREMAFQQEH